MRHTSIRTALILSFILAFSGSLFAQANPESDAETFGSEVTVTEVLLDVLVTDKKGNVIVGLGADDFTVKESGKPVELSSVTFYSNRRLLDGGSVLATSDGIDTIPQPRYFILFFEDQKRTSLDQPRLGLMRRQLEAARRSREWIEKELLQDDLVAVVSYDVKLKIHADFTRNRERLLAAVTNATTGKDDQGNWPSRLPAADAVALRTGLPQGKELRDKTETIYKAIQVLAQASGRIVGRKNLVLFSTGIGQLDIFQNFREDARFFRPTVQELNHNNVAVYPIDLLPSNVEYGLSDGLNQLAMETGGRYFNNFTNFLTPLSRLADENSGYYLLSYRAAHPNKKSGFQKVKVDTKNREFKVRTRSGYRFGES